MATITALVHGLVNGIFRRHLLMAHRNGTPSAACEEAEAEGEGDKARRAALGSYSKGRV